MRSLLLIAAGLAAASVLGGCTTTTSGTALPAPDGDSTQTETQPSNSDELPTAGAPRVDDPLDTARFQQDPCLALTAAQSQALDFGTAGRPVDNTLGNACKWQNDSIGGGSAQVDFLDKDPRGLSSEYEANRDGRLELFTELQPIEGYPAVVRGTTDIRDIGGCTVVVGTSDEIAFEVPVFLSEVNIGKKDPCEVSAQIAGMALQTMKAD